MRMGLVTVGVMLLIAGIGFEALYMSDSQVTFSGAIVSQSTWLATGIVFIIGGLLLSWAGYKIPKVQMSRS